MKVDLISAQLKVHCLPYFLFKFHNNEGLSHLNGLVSLKHSEITQSPVNDICTVKRDTSVFSLGL